MNNRLVFRRSFRSLSEFNECLLSGERAAGRGRAGERESSRRQDMPTSRPGYKFKLFYFTEIISY